MSYNPETGERLMKMPPEIAAGIVKVMKAVKQLGTDERNQHGGYNYVSTDKFMGLMRPLLAEAGLLVMMDERAIDTKEFGKNGTAWLFAEYDIWLYHESGAEFGPMTRRTMVPAAGAQSFGALQSYLLKYFMRNLFQIPTGEKDADDLPQEGMPAAQAAKGRPNGSRPPANGHGHQAPAAAAPAARPDGNGIAPQVDDEREAMVALYKSVASAIAGATSADQVDQVGLDREQDVAQLKVYSETSYDKLRKMAIDKKASFGPGVSDDPPI